MEGKCAHYLPSQLFSWLKSDGNLVVVLGITVVTKLQGCQTCKHMGGVVLFIQAQDHLTVGRNGNGRDTCTSLWQS